MHKQAPFKDRQNYLNKENESNRTLTFLLQFLDFPTQLIFLFLLNHKTVLQILNLKIICQQQKSVTLFINAL